MKRPDVFDYFAPGRVNLIGEHIDYCGGYVLPFAINLGTYLSIKPNGGSCHVFATDNYEPHEVKVDVNNLTPLQKGLWVNYPLGIIALFAEKGFRLPACDFYYYGNLPSGAGLSSSASVELVTAVALNDLLHSGMDLLDLVKMAKDCENNFVGVNCGIMDQFAVGYGKKNNSILLNCNTLDYSYADFNLGDNVVVVVNTNKVRKLTDSKYNERFNQCLELKKIIGGVREIDCLCDLNSEEIGEYRTLINDDVLFRRLRHVVTENERVFQTYHALKDNNLQEVGKLLVEAHASIRDDYEATGIELDTIVESVVEIDGVIGARMTGGGFGGCALAIVNEDKVEDFMGRLAERYTQKTGLVPSFYLVKPADGAKKI